jgi:parvulin-like peptidyl-prolyl isomerase
MRIEVMSRITMRAVRGIGLAVLTAGLWAGCNATESAEDARGSDVVATVNDEPITREQIKDELKLAKRKYRILKNDVLPPEQWVLLKTNSLNELIKQALLLQEAERQGIKVSRQEFMTYLEMSQEGYDKESFQRLLEIEEISQSLWNTKQNNILMIKKLTEEILTSKIKINDKDLLEYFKGHKEEFQKGEQVRTLHIMVENEDEARRILKMIRKGKSFSELAKDHSLSPEGKTGGDMGYFEAGQMPKGFEDVFKLKINKVSDIIRTPYGVHVFKVIDKKPERKMSFEESKKQIHAKLLREAQERAFQKWVKEIKQKSEIIIKYEVLEKI